MRQVFTSHTVGNHVVVATAAVRISVILAVLVAIFGRIELRRPVLRPVGPGLWRDGATVLGLAAVLAGLLGVAVAGPGYHGPTGLPWGAVVLYLSGAAVLRVVRTRPVRPAATR